MVIMNNGYNEQNRQVPTCLPQPSFTVLCDVSGTRIVSGEFGLRMSIFQVTSMSRAEISALMLMALILTQFSSCNTVDDSNMN